MNILLTGANRGLGLEFVRQYGREGHRIFACARHSSQELSTLTESNPNISFHQLDVTEHNEIDALAKTLDDTSLDLLINNAGIAVDRRLPSVETVDYGAWDLTMKVNVFAPLKMAHAFLPHLEKGSKRCIVTISSIMGSIESNSGGGYYLYRSSKAAVNATMKSLSIDLKERGFTVALLHPGWVKTDMGGAEAEIEPKESIAGMLKVIEELSPSNTGSFMNYKGERLPW